VNTGKAAFVQLVRSLDVTFAYRLSATRATDVSGRVSLAAILSDGAGWERRIALASPHTFSGAVASVHGRLDLAGLSDLVTKMQRMTGSGTSTFSLRVVPRVELTGRVGSEPVDTTFAPQFSLLLDQVSLRPDSPDDGSSPLVVREAETGTTLVPRNIALGRLSLSGEGARRLAVLGLIVSIAALVATLATSDRRRARNEHARIASRLGDRVITIPAAPAIEAGCVTDLADVESLARVAERYDRVVLHWRDGTAHVYLVEEGSTAFRYRSWVRPDEARVAVSDLEDTLAL
jgi:hypothetical protein